MVHEGVFIWVSRTSPTRGSNQMDAVKGLHYGGSSPNAFDYVLSMPCPCFHLWKEVWVSSSVLHGASGDAVPSTLSPVEPASTCDALLVQLLPSRCFWSRHKLWLVLITLVLGVPIMPKMWTLRSPFATSFRK